MEYLDFCIAVFQGGSKLWFYISFWVHILKGSTLPLLNIPSTVFPIMLLRSIRQWISSGFPFCRTPEHGLVARQWSFDLFPYLFLGWFLRKKEAHDHGNNSPEQKEILSYHCCIWERLGETILLSSWPNSWRVWSKNYSGRELLVHLALRFKCNQSCPQGPAIKTSALLTFWYLVRGLFTVRKCGNGCVYVCNLLGWG